MLLTIGYFIVITATLGGFMLAGGRPMALAHVSEFVVILGVALGMMVISCPKAVMVNLITDIKL